MRYKIFFFRVLLPAIFCSIIAYITGGNLWFGPLVFGLVVGLANWNLHRYDPFFGCLFSVVLSYVVFVIGWFGAGFWKYILEYLLGDIFSRNDIFDLSFLITTFIVAPLLIYLLYRLLLKFPMSRFTLLVIFFSIIILVFTVMLFQIRDDKNSLLSNFSVWHVVIWQLLVALGLQLMANQKEILK